MAIDTSDFLIDYAGNDTINALQIIDMLIGGLGKDTLTGGAGGDTFVISLS